MQSACFTPLYGGNIAYYAALLQYESIVFEQCENYYKQSFVNRMQLLMSHGKMDLSIPISSKGKTPLAEVLINYNEKWNSLHWKSIVSAYASSPFFMYLADDLAYLYKNPPTRLLEFNVSLIQFFLKVLEHPCQLTYTETFEKKIDGIDLRHQFHPKKDIDLTMPEYPQVFNDRLAFTPNLSILDLLCSQGKKSKEYLLLLR
jgi:hypothetical protein